MCTYSYGRGGKKDHGQHRYGFHGRASSTSHLSDGFHGRARLECLHGDLPHGCAVGHGGFGDLFGAPSELGVYSRLLNVHAVPVLQRQRLTRRKQMSGTYRLGDCI